MFSRLERDARRVSEFVRSSRSASSSPRARLLAAAAAALAVGSTAHAQTYDWTVLGGGTQSWNVDANWSGAPNPFPNLADDSANMLKDFTAPLIVNLDAAITVGSLTYGDSGSGTDQAVTIQNGAGGSLTF